MTQLILVRHGQTDWNLARRYQGQKDILLNAEGLRQAHDLATLLSAEIFDAIYSSDLQRAVQTARILLNGRGIPLITDKRLREIGFGEWEGEIFHEMLAKFPERFALSRIDPAVVMAPGGESVVQVAARTSSIADEIARMYPSGRVLVVTHGMALATLVCRARDTTLSEAYDLVPDNAQPVYINWDNVIN